MLNNIYDNSPSSEYVINTDDIWLTVYTYIKNLQDDTQNIKIPKGTILCILPSVNESNSRFSIRNNQFIVVKVMDHFNEQYSIWENLYKCREHNLKKIESNILPFLIAINDPSERYQFWMKGGYLKYKVNDFVLAWGGLFNIHKYYDCLIKYIGEIPEMGPGWYCGLEIMNLDLGYSPQADKIKDYAAKYTNNSPHLSLILSMNWICPTSQKAAKKEYSLFNKIKSFLFGYSTSETIPPQSNQNSLRRTSNECQNKTLYPYRKIENQDKTEVKNSINDNMASNEHGNRSTFRSNSLNNKTKLIVKEESHKSMRFNDDEYAKKVENYDKRIEEKHNANIQLQKLNEINNKTEHIDYIDLVGRNWPTSAGVTGNILNTNSSDQNFTISNGRNFETENKASSLNSSFKKKRNKSANILSHLGNTNSLESKYRETAPEKQLTIEKNENVNSIKKKDKYANKKETDYALRSRKNNFVLEDERKQQQQQQEEKVEPSPYNEIPDLPHLGLGSMVQVATDSNTELYGVIRWIGYPLEAKSLIVGVELDDTFNMSQNLTNGSYYGTRLFKCPEKRAIFVEPKQCSMDHRFTDEIFPQQVLYDSMTNQDHSSKSMTAAEMFGNVECPPVVGSVSPMKMVDLVQLEEICGRFKGIQGHHNSCYLDATLFSMFTFTSVFDSLLFRRPEKDDMENYEEVQKVLREDIVNPLRKNCFVRADRVMKLRHLLDELSSVSGLTCEEKDPEEFLNSLLAQIMRAEPFLKLSSGQDTYFYQLFVEKDERLSFPSVQQLFEQSFLTSGIKLKEVPSCLIIQMPRFGKSFKMYPRILPSQVLDITDVIEDSPRQCTICGKLAEYECRECYGILSNEAGLECTGFCKICFETTHSHPERSNHTPKEISVPDESKILAERVAIPRLYMELFAVVCIETSHYVAFVRAGSGMNAPWCFFDSMADRIGERNGYNIPELVTVPDLPLWLSDNGARIHEAIPNDKMLPGHAKRLFCDAYMCMYQSTDVMMYR